MVRSRTAGAVRDVPGKVGQQLGGDGAVEPFDLAAALRDPDPGLDQPGVDVQADPLEPCAGEVAAVVALEHVRQSHHRPARVGLAAYGLVQRQRGLLGGRGTKEDGVAGDCPGVVVEHDR